MTYSDFLFVQLFMEHIRFNENSVYNGEPYDIIFPEILKHQEMFINSKYNTDDKSEYDCIVSYLENTLN